VKSLEKELSEKIESIKKETATVESNGESI